MKKYIIFFTNVLIPCFLQAQCINDNPNLPCCNGLILTNPINGNATNAERPDMLNRFNWMTDQWQCYMPPYFTAMNPLNNPFKDKVNGYLAHLNLYNYAGIAQTEDKINYYPEDGWELLHRNMGYKPNEITLDKTRQWPYMILYNKYSGAMRFVGFVDPAIGLHEKMITSVRFKQAAGLMASGLFGYMGNYAQTLDKPALNTNIANVSIAPEPGQAFSTDFEIAYDPCICNNASELEFFFKVMKTSTVRMDGRLIGTEVSLDGSGKNPLLSTRDSFMLAVNKKEFTVNGGMRTYSNIDALVAKYKTPQVNPFEKILYDGLKSTLSAVAKGSDKVLDGLVNTGISAFYKKYPEFADRMKGINVKDTLKMAGLGWLAAGANHLSTSIFPETPKIPNIQFIEAEMSLFGQIEEKIDLPASNINLVQPGSKSSLDIISGTGQYAYDWSRYPAYNEALGIVAVLEQPKAKYVYKRSIKDRAIPDDFTLMVKMADALKFYYNPAAEVDIENSKIFAAYSIKVDKTLSGTYESIGDFNRVEDKDTKSNYNYFITNFMPLDCFQSMKAQILDERLLYPSCTNCQLVKPGIDLKVMFFIKYKKNKDGKEKQHLLELTFPLELSETNIGDNEFINSENFGKYPYSILVENRHFTTNTTIQVWNDIIVSGNITTDPGVIVNFIAGKVILVAPNANISGNVNMISGTKPTSCASSVMPVSADYVKAFCKDNNRYKANVPTPTMREDEPTVDVTNRNYQFTQSLAVVPNPFENHLVIHFALAEDSPVSISLTNAIGQVIKIQEFTQKSTGKYEEIMETNDVAPGVYYLTLQTKSGVETKKIVKQL
jgi:Secretion system C-terminal sorting domain